MSLSTTVPSQKVPFGGIEYRGDIYISDENSEFPLSNKELWFVAKNRPFIPHVSYLAKIWGTREQLGCTYAADIEDKVKEGEKRLCVL